ncbi:MAG: class I SAM-dependent methyltransferase [Patescibacteria group bacterium]
MSYKGKDKSNVYKSAEGYDLYASEYDKKLKYLDSFEREIILVLLASIKVKKALDIGSGTGRLIEALKNSAKKIVALDLSKGMLDLAKKKFPEIETVVGDVEELPFKDNSFGLVTAGFMIVHLRVFEQAFDEIYRVLEEGGIFILTNINQRKAPKLKLEVGGEIVIESHYHRPEDVIKALEKSFFKIEKEEFVYENGVWINQIIQARK